MQPAAEPLSEADQRVTELELFFDLVFVFAITQVTGYISSHPTWARFAEGLAILAVLWWAWVSYAWLGNTAASDEGAVRVVMLAAMGAMLIASLAVPHAFGGDALVFGLAYFAVRALHIGAYTIVSREDAELRGAVMRLAGPILPAAGLLVLAGVVAGTPRTACWVAALVVDYGGLILSGTEGWRVEPAHFAERHGLVIIIALGESIVSLGVGAAGVQVDPGLVAGALLGIGVAAALWWAYFDVVAMVAGRRLRAAAPAERVLMARDSYTYLHLPMVAGIILFAVGVKHMLGDVGAHLEPVPAVSLCGGVAMYFLALSTFRRRNIGGFNRPRLVATAALIGLAPAAASIPALAALALVAAVCAALIVYERIRFAAARDRIRHGTA
ncbi:MAG TPA: low temperature requirement protein A [Gaiellales bacterium]|nr:low temperature requirement protein A [Gaiellales bacterium]